MLDEHFRCQPHIITFSNQQFYGSVLRIMTERPHSAGAKTVDIAHVSGRRGTPQNINERELEEVLAIARRYVDQGNDGGAVKSLGLLSPYRDQANAMARRVAERFTATEIDRHQIVTGTAHSLQGDERDVVVLSTVIDSSFHGGSLRFLEDPNLLNVAITRARERLVAVTSVTANQLPAGDTHYLRGFLEHAAAPFDPGEQPDQFDSDFERQVAEALRARGLRVISQYPSCGYSIDLVVTDGTNSLAVECDGPSHFDPEGKYVSDDVSRHYPGVHEPLVDAATFLKAQELLDARSVRGTRERKHHHYLKGLLHCGVCGRRLSCQHSKGRYLYFFCLGQKNDRTTTCREPYVPADRIEDEIARLYQRLQLPEGLIAEVRKEIDKEIARRQRGHAAERKRHSRELARLDAQRRKLLDAYYTDAIDVNTLKKEQERLGREAPRGPGPSCRPRRPHRRLATDPRPRPPARRELRHHLRQRQ
jgi:hypothetical protein